MSYKNQSYNSWWILKGQMVNIEDKVIMLMGGEEQRLNLSPKFSSSIMELVQDYKRLKKIKMVLDKDDSIGKIIDSWDGGAYE